MFANIIERSDKMWIFASDVYIIHFDNMLDFKTLDTPALLEMLVTHTTNYTRMMSEGAMGEEFDSCKKTINLLQGEIKSRNQSTSVSQSDTPAADDDITFITPAE